ncbi:MAG: LytTR family DNA-binding domain-containing protein [Clostridia bacterium]
MAKGVLNLLYFIVCDDNALHNKTLCWHLNALFPRLDIPAEVALITTTPSEVLAYAQNHGDRQNIYLIDIELGDELNGVTLCKQLFQCDPAAYFLYVSAYPDHALECCKAHAYDFILKPYTSERLESCVRGLIRTIQRRKAGPVLIVRIGSCTHQLVQSEILYIEAQRAYVCAHMKDWTLTWRESLNAVFERLEPGLFDRVHKSFIVNRGQTVSINVKDCEVVLSNKAVLPISRSFAALKREQMSIPAPD